MCRTYHSGEVKETKKSTKWHLKYSNFEFCSGILVFILLPCVTNICRIKPYITRPINFQQCLFVRCDAKVGWRYHWYRSNVIRSNENWFNPFAINLLNCDSFISILSAFCFIVQKTHKKYISCKRQNVLWCSVLWSAIFI